MTLRPWGGPDDTTVIQRLASARWPIGPHPGGLGWSAAIGQLADQVVLAEDPRPRGWAGLGDGELLLGVDPSCPGVHELLIDWALSVTDSPVLTVPVVDGDAALRSALRREGFRPDPEAAPITGMFRAASSNVTAVLPPGCRLRPADPDEVEARVEVHRSAWLPAALPWAAGKGPAVSPGATSAFTASAYDTIRNTWLYDATLDLVAEAHDGSLVASCIAWYDPTSKCAEIEPLGVVAEHRHRGIAGALCLEVCRRCAERGGEVVYSNQAPRSDYPAPAASYLKVGFEVVARGTYFTRTPSAS